MSIILISGANSQIGSYLAKQFEAEGKSLLLMYHNRQERLEAMISPKVAVDMTDLNALSTTLRAHKLNISAVIHCAAVRSEDHRELADTDPEVFRRVFEQNVYSAYNLMRTVLPVMRENGYGRVVLFSSDVSKYGLPNGSAYAAAKAAIANLAKSAARENAKINVLINSIAPGPVDTVLEEDFDEEYLQFRKAYFAEHINRTATGKPVSMGEIKALVDFLISPQIRNLCGEEIVLNGGKK